MLQRSAHGCTAGLLFLELDYTPTLSLSAESIVAMEQSMTLEFVDGMILALLPSMLTVA